MEELKHELEKLSKTYVDTPEKEEKILIPFIKRLLELPMKERRKVIPTIGELQYERGEGWMTCCDPATLSGCRTVRMWQQTRNGPGIPHKLQLTLQIAFSLYSQLAGRVYK